MMKILKKLVALKTMPFGPYKATHLECSPYSITKVEAHSPTALTPRPGSPEAFCAGIEPTDVTYYVPTPQKIDYEGTTYTQEKAFTDGRNSSVFLYKSADGSKQIVVKRPNYTVSKQELTSNPNGQQNATLYCSSLMGQSQIEQFETEAAIARKLKGENEYFIVIQDVLSTPITLHQRELVTPLGILPYANGGSLHDYLQTPHPLEEKLKHWQRMVDVMTKLHELDVYSTDLHPKNWLFDDGTLKLADFGLAYTPDTQGVVRPKQGVITNFNPKALQNMIDQSLESTTDEAKLVADFEENMAANDRWMMGLNLLKMICGNHPFTIKSFDITGIKHLLEQQAQLLGKDLSIEAIKSSPKLRQSLIDAQVPDDQVDNLMTLLARCFTNDPSMTVAKLLE